MSTVRSEIRKLAGLASPVVAAQLGSMAMGTVDSLMVSRVGVDSLAAVSLANAGIYAALLIGQGFVHGIDPIVTQAHGARDGEAMGLALQRGVVMSLVVSVPVIVMLSLTGDFLLAIGQDAALAAAAHRYTVVQIPSVPLFLVYLAIRQYLQGREIMRPAMWVIFAANFFNAAANYVLIFGALGFPALGLLGAGIATSSSRIFTLFGLLGLVWAGDLHRGAWVPWSAAAFSAAGLRRIAFYAAPIALQMALEIGAFSGSTLLAGWLGAASLAAHHIVLTLASISFMMALGISQGAVTRVGNLIGAGNPVAAQRAAWVAMGMAAALMSVWGLVFVVFRNWLPLLWLPDDPLAAGLAASILPIAAAFQIFDGTQVAGCGVLRGMGRTRPAAVFNFIGYWVLALPIAGWLLLNTDAGLPGIWWPLALGLAVVATSLVLWIAVRGPGTIR